MKLPIVDLEVEDEAGDPEQVAIIHEDGTIDATDAMVEKDIENCLGPNREAGYRHSSYVEENGNEVIREEETMIQPGEHGYLAVVSEVLPFPYEVDWEEIDPDELSYPDLEAREENNEEQNDDD